MFVFEGGVVAIELIMDRSESGVGGLEIRKSRLCKG